MNRLVAIGLVLTILGLAGYAIGVRTAYAGRAFSVSAVMLGVTLLAIGRAKGVSGP